MSEVRSHLARKGVNDEDADLILKWLEEKRYVSETRLAEREVELARGPRKIGREKVVAKLLARGVDETIAGDVVLSYDDADETNNALSLIGSTPRIQNDPEKAARFLVARGFSEEAVRAAIERTFPEFEF